jgi:hypothetical protein
VVKVRDGGMVQNKAAYLATWKDATVQMCVIHYADVRVMPTSA